MAFSISISSGDILQQVRLSGQLPDVIEAIAIRKFLEHKLLELGMTILPSELQKAADRFRCQHQLESSEATWRWLQRHELSLDDLELHIRDQVMAAKLAEHLFAEQVESYYGQHQLDYTQVVLYEVILEDYHLAMELFYAVQEQEILFTEVAQRYEQDPEHRCRGGYRGIQHLKPMHSGLSTAILAAKPPEILHPIQIGKNIHLIWVEARIQPKLDEKLKGQILEELFSTWLKQELERIQILRVKH